MNKPVVIVGAGLSGLRAASLLMEQGIPFRILEARDRIGGRVLSTPVPDRPDLGRFDLGPTWFWAQYEKRIASLVEELQLPTFVQHNDGAMLVERFQIKPPERAVLQENMEERGVRFTGGVQSLMEALAEKIAPEAIELETRVKSIRLDEKAEAVVEAERADGTAESLPAAAVILALPPRLAAHHIHFSPPLPGNILSDMTEKPTWMASQAKAVAVYDRPFWREAGLSGLVISSVGPMEEIYDASPADGGGALFGFFGLPSAVRQQLGEEKVVELAAEQLIKLFGKEAENPRAILYKDWAGDSETAVEEDAGPFKNYKSYGPLPSAGIWEKKLVFAGTETNAEYSGHLEGALRSAEAAVIKITGANSR
ncbi:flavin monoamine oxidase family protein [Alkalicoccus halolimnae]|uniref:FAD-dependent oxidoreductase n=1 Tax=Alkalicoccus halolimnae TaxID=1667239 RepID=A0A5C7FGA0_9BACI|nr:FAD-dependent oxidoreductase [Alkalicoccus halolimnae]TXF85294.1 amine oxidase [Alkalicoccus halolimnae]